MKNDQLSYSLNFKNILTNLTSKNEFINSLNELKEETQNDELINDYINPHFFNYIINPGDTICEPKYNELEKNLDLIAFVLTSPKNFRNRMNIRLTWSNNKIFKRLKVIFLLGKSENEDINRKIKQESNDFGDIVQEDFLDSYNNLTFKTVMGFKWVSNHCPNANFVLKVDDDVLVNSHYLLGYLEKNTFAQNTTNKINNTFFCYTQENAPVIRDKAEKFFVSYEEFEFKTFPTYCDGPAYMFTIDLAIKLYKYSLYSKFFKFEDVYVGMLADKLNVTFVNLKTMYAYNNYLANIRVRLFENTNYFFFYPIELNNFKFYWNLLTNNLYI